MYVLFNGYLNSTVKCDARILWMYDAVNISKMLTAMESPYYCNHIHKYIVVA